MDDVMKKLVLLITGLAILGAIIGLILYFGIDLPLQQAGLQAPMNFGPPETW